jgi:PKD repeat protein
MRVKGLLIFITSLVPAWLYGQAPVASFNAPPTGCLNETLSFQNTSTSATEYVWDFCHDDLRATPTGTLLTTLTSGTYHSIRFVFDAGEWMGFVTDLGGSRLLRLDFGSSLGNTPIINNLGNQSGFSSPGDIEFVQHSGTWYGFVLNLFGNSMIRLTFGNGIKQPPTLSENLGNVDAALSTPSGLQLVSDGAKFWAIIVNLSSNTVRVFDFGNTPTNTPTLAATVASGGFNDIYGIALARDGSNWFGLVGSFSVSKTYLLNFGSALTNSPTITEINGIPQGADLDLVKEADEFHAIARSRTDGLYRIDFGTSLPGSPVVTRLGPLGVLTSEARNIALVRDAPNWKAFSLEISTNRLVRTDFVGNCAANVSSNSSSAQNPTGLFYKNPGTYSIELTAKNGVGLMSTVSQSITIFNQTSSGAIIQKSNEQCTGASIVFSASSSGTLTNLNWNFGDGNIGSGATINHDYSNDGQYIISLEAIEQNGCRNSATTTVSIFDAPVANFNLPMVAGNVCTLQGYTFTNTSIVDAAAPVVWTWQVDGTPVAASQNLIQSFASINNYNITLQASIPGCSNSITKGFSVAASGPQVGFTFTGQCLGSPTQFTNTTVGSVTSYSWSFGDGQTSTQTSPLHQFLSTASFGVTLQAANAAGCMNYFSQQVAVADTPQPDFFIDLPPFSCSGTPTQFNDATPLPNGSNIISWQWHFGDGAATASVQNPTHTYLLPGNYTVTLAVETNLGCVAFEQHDVTIATTPTADFTTGPTCLNQGTAFEVESSTGIQSWQWSIGNSTYTVPAPIHTFTLSGDYPVTLQVVGTNNCESLVTKTISIKPVPLVDFSSSAACAAQPITFTDQTTGVDAPQTWVWNFDGTNKNGSPSIHTFISAGAKPVTLQVTTQSGCQYALSKNIIVAPAPVAAFTTSSTQGPPPLLVQFTNTSQNAVSYAWHFGLSSANSTLTNPQFNFATIGDYLVELTATNGVGCSDTKTQIISVLIPSYDLALESMTVLQNLGTPAKQIVVRVQNNSNVPVSRAPAWVTGSSGLRVKTELDIQLAAQTSAEFLLPIEVFSNETFLCVALDVTGDMTAGDNQQCETLGAKPEVAAPYPNPADSQIMFDVIMPQAGRGQLQVANMQGKTVFSQSFGALADGLNQVEIDLSLHSPGLYLAVWEVSGRVFRFPFLLR